MKNLTDFRKTVETGMDPRLILLLIYFRVEVLSETPERIEWLSAATLIKTAYNDFQELCMLYLIVDTVEFSLD